MHNTPLDGLIHEYYKEIFRYCAIKLNQDYSGAEDCTQEVFCLLVKKSASLDISKDIRPWLYAAADKIIMSYKRKHQEIVPLEALTGEELSVDFPYNDILLSLDEEEKKLLTAYFNGADRAALAKEHKISLPALYKRISRIKEKLLDMFGNNA